MTAVQWGSWRILGKPLQVWARFEAGFDAPSCMKGARCHSFCERDCCQRIKEKKGIVHCGHNCSHGCGAPRRKESVIFASQKACHVSDERIKSASCMIFLVPDEFAGQAQTWTWENRKSPQKIFLKFHGLGIFTRWTSDPRLCVFDLADFGGGKLVSQIFFHGVNVITGY